MTIFLGLSLDTAWAWWQGWGGSMRRAAEAERRGRGGAARSPHPRPAAGYAAFFRVSPSSSEKLGRSPGSMLRRANSTAVIGASPRAKESSAVRMHIM